MKPKNELTREQSRALLAAKLGASAAGVALAQAVGFPLPVSACCGAAMRIAGEGATHWHECGACGKPTDAAQPEPASAPGPSPVAANRRRSAASKRGAAARAATAKAQAEHKAEAVRARIAGAVCCGVWTREHAFAAECKPPRKWRFDFACVTRKVALERAYRALSEYLIRGVKTTIPLHKAIMADPVFIEGKATTGYMEDFLARTATDLFS